MLADQKGRKKEDVETWSGYPGGAPCNVAAGLGLLGIPVAFVSCLGKDDKGNQLFDLLSSRNVDMSSVQIVDAPTRDVYVVRTNEGDRIFDSFGQDTTTYCDCFIDAEKLPVDKIQAAAVLVTGTLGLAYPVTAAAMHAAVSAAKEAGTLVLVDVNWRPVFWEQPDTALERILPYVNKADLVKITDEEVEWAFGVPAKEALAHPDRVLAKLPNARGVLVTGGSEGAAYCVRVAGKADVSGFVPVYKVDIQDTTGAGDAFTCGILAYFLLQKELEPLDKLLSQPQHVEAAVKFGAACGALTATDSGAIAAQPRLEEIQKLVASAKPGADISAAA